MSMFCYQCEQTAKGTGCTVKGVCGKEEETAALQDLLIHSLKGLSTYTHRARPLGVKDGEIDRFTVEALFTTITNVNFDSERIVEWIKKADTLADKAQGLYEEACKKAGRAPEIGSRPASCRPAGDLAGMVSLARQATSLDDFAESSDCFLNCLSFAND